MRAAPCAALEVRDAAWAEPGFFGELLLGQRGGNSELAKYLSKWDRPFNWHVYHPFGVTPGVIVRR